MVNNKKFVLKVNYSTGKMCMLTDTPDLLEAIQEFNTKMKTQYGSDKGDIFPSIKSAEILPLLYESIYG